MEKIKEKITEKQVYLQEIENVKTNRYLTYDEKESKIEQLKKNIKNKNGKSFNRTTRKV